LINKGLAPHEILEVHELLAFKNVCATKSATARGLVSDPELKQLLQQDLDATQQHIQELRDIVANIAQ
jgi:similar to spore coat protein